MRSLASRVRAHVLNPVVRTVLRSPAHRLISGSLLLLDDTGQGPKALGAGAGATAGS